MVLSAALSLCTLSPFALNLPRSLPATPAVASPQTLASPPVVVGRREAITSAGSALLAAALADTPAAALADVRGANQDLPKDTNGINKYLATLSLPPLKVPGGFTPLMQYIGTATPANIDGQKVKSRPFKDTLLVRFVYPSGWIVETPSIDENGEAGNIGANNYVKGDSCNFAALELPKGSSIDSLPKEFWKGWLSSQMSSDVYEDIKIKKIRPVELGDGSQTVKFDFGYTLLTRAGFTVLRQGIATASIVDDAVVGIVTATTALRYKEMNEKLDTITDSFRVNVAKAPAFDLTTGLN